MFIRPLLVCALALAPLSAQSPSLDAGIAHFNARRWADADAVFSAIAKAQPTNADAALWLGKTLLVENKASAAEEWLTKATTLSPRSSDAFLWLARAIGQQAQQASKLRQPFLARRMKAAVDKSVDLDAGNLDARELRWQYFTMAPGFMGGGEDRAKGELAEIAKRNRYRGDLLSVQMAARAKDTAAVERTLRALMAAYPDSVAPVSGLAGWYADHKRPAEAWALVDAFVKRRPTDPLGQFQIGRLAGMTGQQLDRGEDVLRRLLTTLPAPAPGIPSVSAVHFRLGVIAEKKGDKAAARAAYEEALRRDTNNEGARRALAALK